MKIEEEEEDWSNLVQRQLGKNYLRSSKGNTNILNHLLHYEYHPCSKGRHSKGGPWGVSTLQDVLRIAQKTPPPGPAPRSVIHLLISSYFPFSASLRGLCPHGCHTQKGFGSAKKV